MKRFICAFLILSIFSTSAAWCAEAPPLMLNPITMQSSATALGIYTGRSLALSNSQLNQQLALRQRIKFIKGDIGETVMHFHVQRKWSGLYVRVNAQLGSTARQGIDGLYVSYDKQGNPSQVLVGEAKYGSSRLGNTAIGKQMSEPWIKSGLIDAADNYNRVANDIDAGNIQRSPTKPPAGNSSKGTILLKNGRRVQFWTENDTCKYCCDGKDVPPAELAAGLRSHAILFMNTVNGVIPLAGSMVCRIKISGDTITITTYEVDAKGNKRGGDQTFDSSSLPLKIKQLLTKKIKEALIAEYQCAGMDEQRAIKMVDKDTKNKSTEQLLKMYGKPLLSARFLFLNVLRSSLYGSAISAVTAGLMQLFTEGKVDAKGLAMGALTGGVAAGVGQLAGNATVILTNTKIGQKIVNWLEKSPLHLSGRLGMFFSTLPGAAATSALFSYGLYFLGMTDLRTAHRSMVSGMAGAAGSYLVSSYLKPHLQRVFHSDDIDRGFALQAGQTLTEVAISLVVTYTIGKAISYFNEYSDKQDAIAVQSARIKAMMGNADTIS
ncbi:hypothetical protein [Pyramidobacter porci]